MKSVTVSAPCKVHLLGEHTVVYGKPAILAAVGKRLTVNATVLDKPIVRIRSGSIPCTEVRLDETIKQARNARIIWKKFSKTKDIKLLTNITSEIVAYPLICVGETILSLKYPGKNGISIEISSDIPIGGGLGSSAAIPVSIAASLMQLMHGRMDLERINGIAYVCEKIRHGTPSGGDNATVTYGGLVWYQKESEILNVIKPIPFDIPDNVKKSVLFINSGKPKESTGEMVSLVRLMYDSQKQKVQKILDNQEKLVMDILPAIKSGDINACISIIRKGEANLEKLGVCSPKVSRFIREIELAGGAAKICGGGGKANGTGIVLAIHPHKEKLKDILDNSGYPFFEAELGVEGVQVL